MTDRSSNLESLLKRVGARIPASVTPATRIEIHPSEWIELADEIERLRPMAESWESYEAAQERKGERRLAVETPAPQAPIAWVVVADNGGICASGSYAPGLPPGNHDLYCVPDAVAPMMRAEKASGCPDAAHMGEHACANKSQCWEPCGELGHSEQHAKASPPHDRRVDGWCHTCSSYTCSVQNGEAPQK